MRSTLAATTVLLATLAVPTLAQAQSHNTELKNVPLTFNEDDIGMIVELVYMNCNASPKTQLANGPYVRISNGPKNALTPSSTSNYSLDFVVWDSSVSSTGQLTSATVPSSGSGNNLKTSIKGQIGIDPGISLSASIEAGNTSAITVRDTTNLGSTPAAGEIVDAGAGIGGLDAAVLIKNGTPKTADIICDTNMNFVEGSTIVYGFQNYNFGQPINRMLLLWQMGPSPFGTPGKIVDACNAANGATNSSSFPITTTTNREAKTIGLGGDAVREWGEGELPQNYTSCSGVASYCDQSEPTPSASELSGNACNRNRGTSAPPTTTSLGVNADNRTCTSTKYGLTMYFEC